MPDLKTGIQKAREKKIPINNLSPTPNFTVDKGNEFVWVFLLRVLVRECVKTVLKR